MTPTLHHGMLNFAVRADPPGPLIQAHWLTDEHEKNPNDDLHSRQD
jgi:hypothetical protein